MDMPGIDWKLVFALGALASNIAFLPYIRDILAKRTQPHIYTWLIWVITQGTAVAGIWYGGGGAGGWALMFGLLLVLAVFFLCFPHGTKNITLSDTLVLILALGAVVLWWQLHQPVLAILLVSAIDALGYIPTFRKSYMEPWSETALSWGIFSVGNALSIAALEAYNLLTVTYIATIMMANIILVVFLLVRRTKIQKPVT